ncbi:hypothetical protein HY025_00765 [Candidatus Daviesbacteria bacterium]|nr:hypothetical protein [Candidatus Daviesbacteria bacterium]
MKNPGLLIIGGFFLLSLVIAVIAFALSGSTNSNNPTQVDSSKSNREVALSCTLDMYTQFHIHPHLQIIINGQDQIIPADVGIIGNCLQSNSYP